MKFDIVVLSELQRRKNNGWEFNIFNYACLDVDGVYLTFELAAIRTVLPVKEAVTPEGAVIEEGSAIEE